MSYQKFEVGKEYAIHIGSLSSSLYTCVKRTEKSVTFRMYDKNKTFRVKDYHQEGESFYSSDKVLWALAFGKQEIHEYMD